MSFVQFETTDEQDRRAVELGLMTEEERITRAYERIHRQQLKRVFLRPWEPTR